MTDYYDPESRRLVRMANAVTEFHQGDLGHPNVVYARRAAGLALSQAQEPDNLDDQTPPALPDSQE
ncbi:hypothetical protein KC960_05070 [Candidatus Saccharibacteria bacterium]|nr:hypothetical protein [Candidatus Saccharibacteria bacterium]